MTVFPLSGQVLCSWAHSGSWAYSLTIDCLPWLEGTQGMIHFLSYPLLIPLSLSLTPLPSSLPPLPSPPLPLSPPPPLPISLLMCYWMKRVTYDYLILGWLVNSLTGNLPPVCKFLGLTSACTHLLYIFTPFLPPFFFPSFSLSSVVHMGIWLQRLFRREYSMIKVPTGSHWAVSFINYWEGKMEYIIVFGNSSLPPPLSLSPCSHGPFRSQNKDDVDQITLTKVYNISSCKLLPPSLPLLLFFRRSRCHHLFHQACHYC